MALPENIFEELPPWDLYPYSPMYRQGNPEAYLRYGWLPLWQTLSAAQKQEYLRHWNAPEEWRTYCQELEKWQRYRQESLEDWSEDEWLKRLDEE